MISYNKLPDGGVYVEQTPKELTLYLDLWFWSRIAKSGELRQQFLDSAASRCTIMYSMAAMIELATIRHPEQVKAIYEVMEAVDFGFIEDNPNKVVELENQHETEVGSGIFSERHPASDREILDHLIRSKYPDTDLSMKTLFEELLQEIPDRYKEMKNGLARTMNELVRKARKSDEYMRSVAERRRKRQPQRTAPPYTKDVLQRFLDYVIVSKNLRMTRNDWMDMMHLIVPLSYLKIIQADSRWVHFVRSELRLQNPNLAQVYGPREAEEFLECLQ